MNRPLFLLCLGLAALSATPAAHAEALYKCSGEKGALSIQSEPCPKGMTQVWKRETAPEPGPTPEELAARTALAEAEALRAAEAARMAEAERLVEQAKAEQEARLRALEAASGRPARKSDCTLAHEFQDTAMTLKWLELSQSQRERMRNWVIDQCRDPDAPVAEALPITSAG